MRRLCMAVLAVVVMTPAIALGATLELYGNFHTMGVIVTLGAGEDSDGDAQAALR